MLSGLSLYLTSLAIALGSRGREILVCGNDVRMRRACDRVLDEIPAPRELQDGVVPHLREELFRGTPKTKDDFPKRSASFSNLSISHSGIPSKRTELPNNCIPPWVSGTAATAFSVACLSLSPCVHFKYVERIRVSLWYVRQQDTSEICIDMCAPTQQGHQSETPEKHVVQSWNNMTSFQRRRLGHRKVPSSLHDESSVRGG